jgi:endo-1,4-beta-mannosidase
MTRFGVNYTPSRGWFHHWLDFDLDDVRADLDSIAALGFDHVRVFPVWPVFQPNRALVRPRALAQLVSVVEAAAARGLDVAVDGLQGHLSSFDFLPSWTQTWHRRNLFTDPDVIEGQSRYLRAIGEALRDLPNFLGLTLGNEVNLLTPDNPIAPDDAARWLETLLAVCGEAAPGRFHTHSEYDAVWYEAGHPFTPAHAARLGAATTVHSWVFNGTTERHGSRGAATLHHAEYLIELAHAYALDPERPVWLQEVGAPAPDIPADQAADFTEQTLANALTCARVWGVTWWCSHDIDRALVDFPEREYDLGLLTVDRAVKPAGARLQALLAGWRAVEPVPRPTAVVIGSGDTRARCAPGGAVFEAWAALAADGVRAALVVDDDPAHLAARGITEVVHADDTS